MAKEVRELRELEQAAHAAEPTVARRYLPLREPWSTQRLKAVAGHRTVSARLADEHGHTKRDGGHYSSQKMTLANALDQLDRAAAERRPSRYYCAQLAVRRDYPELAEPLHADAPCVDAFGSLWRGAPALYVGSGNSTPRHHDALENLLCVLAGRKSVELWPRDIAGAVTGGGSDDEHRDCSDVTMLVELGAGDVLYMPARWDHRVWSPVGEVSISVSYWFSRPSGQKGLPDFSDDVEVFE